MQRREFIRTAAGAAAFAGFASGAAKYDLVVKGGRVIDPWRKLDGVQDVAVANGRIAAVGANLTGAETIDASGRLVVPGLIDIHTHALRTKEGGPMCLEDGVTALIDAGSQGADHIADIVAIAKGAPQLCRALLNIGRAGIIPEGDTMDLKRADVAAAKDAIAKNRDYVVGVKARLSREVAGENDFEVLKRAQEVASAFKLPVMIHMGQTVSPLSKLLPVLKRGDIVTHLFAPPPNSIIDDAGNILPEVAAARKRGVFFDVGNGRAGHLRWDIADKIMKAKFVPDTFSTDWNADSRTTGVIDLANVMSKLLMLGMPLDQVIAGATINSARIFPAFHGRGTLKPGAPADIAILDLGEGSFDFVDNYMNTRAGHQRLFPKITVLAGKKAAMHA